MILYSLVVLMYGAAIKFAALWNPKAKQWTAGRKNWRANLKTAVSKLGSGKKWWFHCASYGEFEQGRPLMEKIKATDPTAKIILTFFSPSGYEPFKNWTGADLILYLPLDTKRNAEDFVSLLKPDIIVFVKYEFWIHFLFAIKANKIPCYLVSATFKDHHPFFKSYGSIFRRSLQSFTWLFLQEQHSADLLAKINVSNVSVTGDTRFDRVLQIKKNFKPIPELAAFKGNSKLIAAGSTWPKDEDLLIAAYAELQNMEVKLFIAPHNLSEAATKITVEKLKKAGLSYSVFTQGIDNNARVLIVDTMGMLSRLYYYADCAYIGGGFNGGLHNTLEPAVYGIPVAFYGEDYIKYNEAVQMKKREAAVLVDTPDQLTSVFQSWLNNNSETEKIKKVLEDYFEANKNASEKILQKIVG